MTGEKLKKVLLCFKVSQTDIAKKIGMSQQSLNQMLGASDVKSGLLEKIAYAVNVSVSRLYELACCSSATDSCIIIVGAISGENRMRWGKVEESLRFNPTLERRISSKTLRSSVG